MKEFCVDLELAKELKENDFPQKPGFSWWEYISTVSKTKNIDVFYDFPHWTVAKDVDILCFAPTSDELLKELPEGISITKCLKNKSYLVSKLEPNISKRINEKVYKGFQDEKLPNALAKMWLYLKKEGYIK